MDCNMPGFPVHHQLLELTQAHVHWVGNAIQPFHPLQSPSPFAFSLSQDQSFPMSWLFTAGGQSIGASASASIFPMNIQGWLPLVLSGLISLSPRDTQESSPAPQFESINSSVLLRGILIFPWFYVSVPIPVHAFYCCGIVCIKKNTLTFFFYLLRNF